MQYREADYAADEWDIYWYEKNLQGDIVAVYNESGVKLLTYTYNAWGEITNTSYYGNGGSTTVDRNPFRYRGYYYDADLGMYYLQTRYYDAVICRFISADGYVSTGQGLIGYNMYAYCNNNPVNFLDCSGEFASFIGIVIFVVALVTTVVICGNIGTVIASEISVSNIDVEPMNDETFEKYTKDTDSTYGMSLEEKMSYIKKIRLIDTKIAENWSEAEMLREITYHDSMFELMIFLGKNPNEKGTLAYQANHVDFEKEQTFKTYFRRFIGNAIPW